MAQFEFCFRLLLSRYWIRSVDLGNTTYFGGTANSASFSFRDHIVRGGINYQFTSGPVVAKY